MKDVDMSVLKEKFELPVWVGLLLVSALLLFMIMSWSMSNEVSGMRAAESLEEDQYRDVVTERVASQGLAATWDWWASHMLMWLYHGRNVLALLLFVVLAIHGFKVVGR